MQLSQQVDYLFLLALPIACIAWTITHEELFKEFRYVCLKKSRSAKTLGQRKFFYVFTCEYCFSHYVTIVFLIITRYHLLFFDWRGYLIAGFAIVWIANIYMSIYGFVRVGMKKEKLDADIEEVKLKKEKKRV
ncbi:MAG: hypothetical protein ABIO60_03250 [Aquaticitalea sp.]